MPRTAQAAAIVRACRICGCTDTQACAGGCRWVAGDLCSSCDPETAARDAERRLHLALAVEALGHVIADLGQATANIGLLDAPERALTASLEDRPMLFLEDALLSLAGALDSMLAAHGYPEACEAFRAAAQAFHSEFGA